jgi:DNA-binding MarR family transcriptional regulator
MPLIFDDPDLGRIFYISRLHRLLRQLDNQIETIAAEHGIESPPECTTILLSLWQYGPMPLNPLAESVGESPAVVGRRVRKLVEQRFARRSVQPQVKRVEFLLTQAGYRQAEALMRLSPKMEEIYRSLDAELGVDLAQTVERLSRSLKARPLMARLSEPVD